MKKNIKICRKMIEAVKRIGLLQIKEMDMSEFENMQEEAEMLERRLAELKKVLSQ